MFEYRLQICCICVVLYIFVYYISRKNLKTEFYELFISMLITSLIYLFLDIYTFHLVNNRDSYSPVYILFFHRLFYISIISDFYLAFIYELMLARKEFKIPKKEMLLLDIPFLVSLIGVAVLPVTYKKTDNTAFSSGQAIYCLAICIAIYMVLSYVISYRYASRELGGKYRAVIVSMSLMITVMVIQMIIPDMLITSIAVTMLVLSIYMSLGDPMIYRDDDIGGFNRDGFGEVLDSYTRENRRFLVISIEIANWTELTDMSCGISAKQLLTFAPKLGERLRSPAYRARHNCIAYISPDTNQMRKLSRHAKAAATELISLELQHEHKNMKPDVHTSIIKCPEEAGTTNEILTKIYSMLLATYRGAIYYDEATGCVNRNAFENDIEDLSDKMRSSSRTICIMADVNGLKRTNDTYGHLCGDELIRETAQILMKYFNDMGAVYRIGGDEFIIIVYDRELSEVQEKLRKMEQGEMGRKLTYGGTVSFAVGTACAGENDITKEDLMKRADAAMYEDKKKNGNMR